MLTVLAVCALILGLVGAAAGLLALRTLGRLRRSVGILGRGGAGRRETFLEIHARHIELSERTRRDFDELNERMLLGLTAVQTSAANDMTALHHNVRTELTEARGEIVLQSQANRTSVETELAQIRELVKSELSAIRTRFETGSQQALDEITAERERLAADNSAARDQLRTAIDRAEKAIDGSIRRVALVRFDAFDDLSGRLSFCLALLDGRGDGIALTSLAGRTETRLYAKPIDDGQSTTELSPEERQAVKAALSA
jgi:hypothetical protein